MRVLVFATAFAPATKAGGPSRSITNMVSRAARSHQLVVVAPDRDLGDDQPFPELSGHTVRRPNLTVFYLNLQSVRHWVSLVRRLGGEDFDLIVVNSLWHRRLALLPAALIAARVINGPLLLMPRGELEPGALALKSQRKRLGGHAFRALYRKTVWAVGSTSESEARTVADWFPDVPVLATTNQPERIAFGTPGASSKWLRVAVIGRIHPTKGLAPLLRGLARNAGEDSHHGLRRHGVRHLLGRMSETDRETAPKCTVRVRRHG